MIPNLPPKSTNVVTTAPLEWISVQQASRLFSIGRSSLYNLINEGKLRSVSLRIRGNIRGKRLISAESLRMLMEAGAEG
jgi:excisionase family DNA binding protein